jgi:AcrR family transcriptional regulator
MTALAGRRLAGQQAAFETEIRSVFTATLDLAAASPTCDVTMAQVLKESGLSASTFYRYFRSKEELWLAIVSFGRERLVDHIEHKMAEAPDPHSAIGTWTDCILDQARNETAARRSRPYAVMRPRLVLQFPEAMAQHDEACTAPLLAHLTAAGVRTPDPGLAARSAFLLASTVTNEALLRRTTVAEPQRRHVHDAVSALLGVPGGG